MNQSTTTLAFAPGKVGHWPLPTLASGKELSALEGPCVSVYLAEHRPGAESRTSLVHLHTLLNEAEKALVAHDILETDRQHLLAPFRQLLQDPDLQEGHREGLVLFRTPRSISYFRVPGLHTDAVFVANQPQLLPLLRHLSANPDFYVLKLSRKAIELLRVDLAGWHEVELPNAMIQHYDKFKNFEQPDHNLRGRSGAGTQAGARGPVSFSTGSEREMESGHFHDYCRAIDRALHSLLLKDHLPLVLAGTKTEVTAFRAASSYDRVLKASVAGSPESGLANNHIVEEARGLLRLWISPERKRVVQLYENIAGTSKGESELHAIVQAAAQGRVEYLLVAETAREMGNYDAITERQLLSGDLVARDVDLVNAAAVDTLRHGGKVLPLADGVEAAPVGVAAVLRF